MEPNEHSKSKAHFTPADDVIAPDVIAPVVVADADAASSHRRGCPPPTLEESRQRWEAWYQAMEFSHEMLLAGLRQRIGPDGDLQAAYREWYERYQALKWEMKQRAT